MSTRLNSLSLLHPAFEERLILLVRHLQVEDPGFQVLETIRSPQRQNELYAVGRDPGHALGLGKHLTDAMAYQSAHQFGMAADIWPCDGGRWQWIGRDDPRWGPLLELTPQFGLHCLSWERPHVEMADFNWRAHAPGPLDTPGWMAWLTERNKT